MRHTYQPLLLALGAASFAFASALLAAPPTTRAGELVASVTAAHPEVANLELALTTDKGCHTVAASDPRDVGEACDSDELGPMRSGVPDVEEPSAADPVYDVTQALHDSRGRLIGAVGMDLRPKGLSREQVLAAAKKLLAELEREIPSQASLMAAGRH